MEGIDLALCWIIALTLSVKLAQHQNNTESTFRFGMDFQLLFELYKCSF